MTIWNGMITSFYTDGNITIGGSCMSSAAQRAELQSQIWKIANEVRGSVDGWDFKQYVLGTLFYRFISENFSAYMEGGDDSIHYAELDDTIITKEIKEDAIKTKGYFIYPSHLFCRIAEGANTNESLNNTTSNVNSSINETNDGNELFSLNNIIILIFVFIIGFLATILIFKLFK